MNEEELVKIVDEMVQVALNQYGEPLNSAYYWDSVKLMASKLGNYVDELYCIAQDCTCRSDGCCCPVLTELDR
jgi:hypothetical protein